MRTNCLINYLNFNSFDLRYNLRSLANGNVIHKLQEYKYTFKNQKLYIPGISSQ